MERARTWALATALGEGRIDSDRAASRLPSPQPPFSFTYGGRRSADSSRTGGWTRRRSESGEHRTTRTLVYTDPATSLTLRCEAVLYKDFPTIEWTLFLKNDGTKNTPLITDLKALDATFTRDADAATAWKPAPVRPWFRVERMSFPASSGGCVGEISDYEPLQTLLEPGHRCEFFPPGLAPTELWPYFNLEWPDQGVILAIGWQGKWSAEFARDDKLALRVLAGQKLTHFTLQPGEEIRTPLVVLQFYKGGWLRRRTSGDAG